MELFIKQNIELHSGKKSDFKIECDALTDKDVETLAYLISKRFIFREVVGVPSGGVRIAKALEKYKNEDNAIDNRGLSTLIVDDVLTTGGSMEEFRKTIEGHCLGVVLFSRGKCPDWIIPLFQMW